MDRELLRFFSDVTVYHNVGLISGILFFLMLGIRQIRDDQPIGYLLLTLSLILVIGHGYYLENLPKDHQLFHSTSGPVIFAWLIKLSAPALSLLFVLFGLLSLARSEYRASLIKIFFGLSLFSYLFLLGPAWPLDVRALVTLLWCLIWFDVELRTAT
jgi:hypothetical protein